MYQNSPLNRTNLNAFRCLSINIKLPTRAGGARWVGHILRALEHFLDGYPAFQLHLEQLAASKEKSDGKAKAIGFLKLLRSQDIIAMALFLQDILTVLHKVSLKFQKHGSIVVEVSLCINTAIKTLQRFSNTDGPFLKKLPKFETSSAPSAGATTRQTYTLTCGSGILATERNVLVEALCTALECHFDDTSVVKATTITDFKMWPTSEEELHTFGDDWMNTLLDQFGSYHDDKDDQIKAEWPMLKTAVLEAFVVSSDTAWLQVNRRSRNEYPHVLNFFDLILTIPATSTACERGFTHMKLVKSQQRSSFKEDIVSDCLMIKLEGDSIKDFNPDASIQYWFDVIARRPGGSKAMKNIKHAKEAVTVIEASTSQEVKDEVERDGVEHLKPKGFQGLKVGPGPQLY